MALFIPFKFDDSRGKFTNWDTTQDQQGSKAYLTTQDHVDLRAMLGASITQPRPLNDLELVTQVNLESNTSYSPLIKMEEETLVAGDNWVKTGTGFNSMTVGVTAAKNNWRLMTLNVDGAAISTDLKSQIAYDTAIPATAPVDLSTQDKLSIVIAGDIDRSGFTQATSYVYLTSRTDADLSQATGRSAQVFFTANTGGATELRVPMSDFTNAGFNPAAVTGIWIHLERAAGTLNNKVYIGGIRGVDDAWVGRTLDQNTRLKNYEYPVTLDLLAATAAVPLIRGARTLEDPNPADGSLNVTFITGGNNGSWIATGANRNRVDLYFREIYNAGANSGSWVKVSLEWKDTDAIVSARRQDWATPTLTDVGVMSSTKAALESRNVASANTGRYLFKAELVGTKVTAILYKIDAADAITSTVWTQVFDNPAYTFRQGRVGLHASFLDRDAYIDDFSSAAIGFATATSRVFASLTPVDGAQLQAVFAEDANLWNSMYAVDLFLDLNKTLSGRGSYRTAVQLMTNQFVMEDWFNTYIEFDIWVPITVTEDNQPHAFVVGGGSTLRPEMPVLAGGQWNHVKMNLETFRDNVTGIPYVIVVEPLDRDLQLGNYWVDNMKIGRRLISWQVRARSDGTWREFRDMVNNPDGAVHLPIAERGKQLQLQAVALREDAWIASFHLFPRYAQLGLPTTDLGFETR